ncbi:NKAP-like protein [Picochlorum sp. SENEW3]|nr:NKAP-like protein [Picochlorum sp. SENEW3]
MQREGRRRSRRDYSPGRYSSGSGRRRRHSPDYREEERRTRERKPLPLQSEYPEDVSDDDIRADSRREYRRLKRNKMRERNVRCVYRNTPSPPPGEERLGSQEDDEGSVMLTEDEEELQDELEEHRKRLQKSEDQRRKRGLDEKQEMVMSDLFQNDTVLQGLRARQMEMLRGYLDSIRDARIAEEERKRLEEEENALVGPEPLTREGHVEQFESTSMYGTHLRPGEGSAMAAYVQQGKRIPRRGEVGLDAERIEQFEKIGYVMSGNRNAKMNAIRMRKENQVYTAEEKAALAMLNFEEKKKKEAKIIEDMRKLVDKTVTDVQK